MKILELTLANLFILSILDWIFLSVFQINAVATVFVHEMTPDMLCAFP